MLAFVFALLLVSRVAGYSISVYSHNNKHHVVGSVSFGKVASDEQVADLISRISGHAPLLYEDKVSLPFSRQTSDKVILLEVTNGVLPHSIKPVVRMENYGAAPSLTKINTMLNKNGIETQLLTYHNDKNHLEKYLSSLEDVPVIILHSDALIKPVSFAVDSATFSTLDANATVTYAGPSEFQISQYQICLWSGLVVLLLLYAAIYGVLNMEVIPDSLLFAKYQSVRTSKND